MSPSIPEWPFGVSDEIAVINFTIDQAEGVFDVSFYDDIDDLDFFKFATVRFGKKVFVLQRYKNYPLDGITLLSSVKDSHRGPENLSEFLNYFDLNDSIVLWRKY